MGLHPKAREIGFTCPKCARAQLKAIDDHVECPNCNANFDDDELIAAFDARLHAQRREHGIVGCGVAEQRRERRERRRSLGNRLVAPLKRISAELLVTATGGFEGPVQGLQKRESRVLDRLNDDDGDQE